MKRSTTILTHAAVFAIGVTAAMVIGGGRDAGAAADAAAESSTRQGRPGAAGASGGADSRPARPGSQARGAAADAARNGGVSATERLAMLVKNPDVYERQRGLLALIDSLGPGDFAAVADEFQSLHHIGGSGDEYGLLLRGWAKADPLGALAYVEEHGGRGRESILETWAGTDAAAAESWALAKHEGDGPNPYMASVIRGIAAHDLGHATRLLEAMPRSDQRGEAIQAVARVLLAQGLDAALAYPATIQDPHLRGGLVSEIAGRLARRDPSGAAEWLVSIGVGEVQNRAARQVADALARTNTQEAASFVSKLAPEARAEAARGVIPRMSAGDIEGTARWVSTLAGTPNYDRVVEEFIWSCDQRAPEQSAAWIQGVSDPEQQRRIYHRMLGEWARRDANAVRNWVANNDVPEDIQRRFTR